MKQSVVMLLTCCLVIFEVHSKCNKLLGTHVGQSDSRYCLVEARPVSTACSQQCLNSTGCVAKKPRENCAHFSTKIVIIQKFCTLIGQLYLHTSAKFYCNIHKSDEIKLL